MPALRLRDAALALALALPATASAQGAGSSGDSFTKWAQGVVNYRRWRGGDVTACEITNTVGSLYNQCYIPGVSKPVERLIRSRRSGTWSSARAGAWQSISETSRASIRISIDCRR